MRETIAGTLRFLLLFHVLVLGSSQWLEDRVQELRDKHVLHSVDSYLGSVKSADSDAYAGFLLHDLSQNDRGYERFHLHQHLINNTGGIINSVLSSPLIDNTGATVLSGGVYIPVHTWLQAYASIKNQTIPKYIIVAQANHYQSYAYSLVDASVSKKGDPNYMFLLSQTSRPLHHDMFNPRDTPEWPSVLPVVIHPTSAQPLFSSALPVISAANTSAQNRTLTLPAVVGHATYGDAMSTPATTDVAATVPPPQPSRLQLAHLHLRNWLQFRGIVADPDLRLSHPASPLQQGTDPVHTPYHHPAPGAWVAGPVVAHQRLWATDHPDLHDIPLHASVAAPYATADSLEEPNLGLDGPRPTNQGSHASFALAAPAAGTSKPSTAPSRGRVMPSAITLHVVRRTILGRLLDSHLQSLASARVPAGQLRPSVHSISEVGIAAFLLAVNDNWRSSVFSCRRVRNQGCSRALSRGSPTGSGAGDPQALFHGVDTTVFGESFNLMSYDHWQPLLDLLPPLGRVAALLPLSPRYAAVLQGSQWIDAQGDSQPLTGAAAGPSSADVSACGRRGDDSSPLATYRRALCDGLSKHSHLAALIEHQRRKLSEDATHVRALLERLMAQAMLPRGEPMPSMHKIMDVILLVRATAWFSARDMPNSYLEDKPAPWSLTTDAQHTRSQHIAYNRLTTRPLAASQRYAAVTDRDAQWHPLPDMLGSAVGGTPQRHSVYSQPKRNKHIFVRGDESGHAIVGALAGIAWDGFFSGAPGVSSGVLTEYEPGTPLGGNADRKGQSGLSGSVVGGVYVDYYKHIQVIAGVDGHSPVPNAAMEHTISLLRDSATSNYVRPSLESSSWLPAPGEPLRAEPRYMRAVSAYEAFLRRGHTLTWHDNQFAYLDMAGYSRAAGTAISIPDVMACARSANESSTRPERGTEKLLTDLTMRQYPVYPWYSASARMEAAGGVGSVATVARIGDRLQHLVETASTATPDEDAEVSVSIDNSGVTAVSGQAASPPSARSLLSAVEAPLAPGREGAREGGIASLLGVLRVAVTRDRALKMAPEPSLASCSVPLAALDMVIIEDLVDDNKPVQSENAPIMQMLLPHAHHGALASVDTEIAVMAHLHALAAHTLASRHGGLSSAGLEAELLAHTYVLALIHGGHATLAACKQQHPWLSAPAHVLSELRSVDAMFSELNTTALDAGCSARVDVVDFIVRNRRDAAVATLLQPILDNDFISEMMAGPDGDSADHVAAFAARDGHYTSPLPPAVAQLHLRITARVKLLRTRLLEAAAVRRVLGFADTALQLLTSLRSHALTADSVASVLSSDVRAYIEDVLLWLPESPHQSLMSATRPQRHSMAYTVAALPLVMRASPHLPRDLLTRVYTTTPPGAASGARGWVDDALVLVLLGNSRALQCWRFPSICAWMDARDSHLGAFAAEAAPARVTACAHATPLADRLYQVTMYPAATRTHGRDDAETAARVLGELQTGFTQQWWNRVSQGTATKDKLARGAGIGSVPYINEHLADGQPPVDTGAVYLQGPGDFAILETVSLDGSVGEPNALRVVLNTQLDGGITGNILRGLVDAGLGKFIDAVNRVRKIKHSERKQ